VRPVPAGTPQRFGGNAETGGGNGQAGGRQRIANQSAGR